MPAPQTPLVGADVIPPLSDGHDVRIALGFRAMRDPATPTYFE